MLVLLGVGALAIGNSGAAVMDAFYRGLWMLLPFTMQMALILVLSSTLGAAPVFRHAPWKGGVLCRPSSVGWW
jgi:short subunit fatty acids transporter